MAKPKVRYFQTCDFCHKEYETDEKGMFNCFVCGRKWKTAMPKKGN